MSIKKTLEMSFALSITDFKLRNEGTYLGLIWYLLNPLLLFTLLLLVFHNRLGQNIENYALYLLLGIIIFNFFHRTTTASTKGLIQNSELIKSINFPTEAIVISIIFRSILEHLFEILVFIIFLLFFQVSVLGILYYVIILLFLSLFVYGISLILASLTVYFADLDNMWVFVSRLLWFATPIFYSIDGQTRLFTVNLFNPLYYFITISRELIIYHKMPELWMLLGMIGYSLIALFIGLVVFNKLKKKFAEMI